MTHDYKEFVKTMQSRAGNKGLSKEQLETEEEESIVKALNDKLVKANVPARYRSWELEDYGMTTEDLDVYSERSNGIYITGSTNAHKSSLAASIVRRLLSDRKYFCASWLPIMSLIQRVKSAILPAAKESPYEILKSHGKENTIIVLDDLGRESEHQWDEGIVNSYLWQAYDNNQFLIVTSNVSPDKIYPDPAVRRRLTELQLIKRS